MFAPQSGLPHDVQTGQEALAAFVRGLPGVTSAAQLERLMCECIGVDACVPGFDAYKRKLGGLRMDPHDLAACLWACRDLLRDTTRSFLHVGTNHGHSFFAITEFLWHHVGPTISVNTVDEHNYVLTDVLPFVRPRRIIHPSIDLAGRHYDFVFIEGGTEDDYRNVGEHARVCVVTGADTPNASNRHRVHSRFGSLTVLYAT